MYRLEAKDYVSNKYIGLWGLAAFQAGFINSLGFLACQRFVSHVTGFSTHVGISIGDNNYLYALELFTAPIFFVLGAWFNGFLTVSNESKNMHPRYDLVLFIYPILLTVIMSLGLLGVFGPFGGNLSFQQDFLLLNTLTFLCGMQNACFATLTKGQIRTTHLTGLSTDFGTDLSLILNGSLKLEERILLVRKNWMRFITFTSFSLGAVLSAILDNKMGYLSFLIPILTSTAFLLFYLSFRSIYLRKATL
jgi:uncharacterized membrane protein YoaK (UPF0700 family)